MRLRIVTPLAVVVDEDGVLAVRAEDSSGGFGVLPGHADFLTSLTLSVISWERADASRLYCAVRRGVFSVNAGRGVSIATREAVVGDLATLAGAVLARFRADLDVERSERVDTARLQLAAIRQIMRHMLADGSRGGFS